MKGFFPIKLKLTDQRRPANFRIMGISFDGRNEGFFPITEIFKNEGFFPIKLKLTDQRRPANFRIMGISFDGRNEGFFPIKYNGLCKKL